MCDDINATIDELRGKGLEIRGEPQDEGWGITTTIVLPGGLDMMLYQPRHRTANLMTRARLPPAGARRRHFCQR